MASRTFVSVSMCAMACLITLGASAQESNAVTTAAPASSTATSPPDGEPSDAPSSDAPSSDAQPDGVATAQRARDIFMQGLAHFEAHLYREAIRSFAQAAELVPSADLSFNIARCYEELGTNTSGTQRQESLEQAVEFYRRYLRDRVDPPDVEEVRAHIAWLEEQIEAVRQSMQSSRPEEGRLALTANREGVQVQLDGQSVDDAPWTEPRLVEPGRHRLRLRRAGYIPFEAEVSVAAGVQTVAYADLVEETQFRAIQNEPMFAWGVFGLAAGALGTGIGFGVDAAMQQSVDLERARELASFSDAALGAAIGLALVGVVVWIVEGRAVGTQRVTVDAESRQGLRGPSPEASRPAQ